MLGQGVIRHCLIADWVKIVWELMKLACMQSMQSVVHVHRVHAGIQLSRDQRLRRVRRKVSQTKFFEGYEAGEIFLFEDRDIC